MHAAAGMAAVEMVDPEQTWAAFRSSGLIRRMGPKNLAARRAASGDEYGRLYRSGLYEWAEVPDRLRERLIRVAAQARESCTRAGFLALGGMRWRVTLSGPAAENGWAHTVGDIIVIPLRRLESGPDGDLSRLLVHEAVHVAQRKDPEGALRLIEGEWGFRRIGDEGRARLARHGEIRLNPDTNDTVYELGGRVCQPVFFDSPRSLADIAYLPDSHLPDFLDTATNHEHPYEIMAELVAREAVPAG